jgi:hypothetical protein
MTPAVLTLRPDQSGYAVEDSADEVVRAKLAGGPGRYRHDLLGATRMVTARWTVDGADYDGLRAFYRAFVRAGRSFTLALVVEEQCPVNCLCWFVPESFKLTGQRGNIYEVAAKLEIEPPDNYDMDLDRYLLILVEALGWGWRDWLRHFDRIINHKLPQIVGRLSLP